MIAGTQEPLPAAAQGAEREVVNDFSIHVATVNGSGSQTSNSVLLRALFYMGIPVSGKNLFPSNIAGLPTWFTIRASHQGYVGRDADIDVLVCMNPQTVQEDVRTARSGVTVIYDEPLAADRHREDLRFVPVPFGKLVAECCPNTKLRKLVVNMVYVGVLAELYGIEDAAIEQALDRQFAGKVKAVPVNRDAIAAGRAYAREHIAKLDAYRFERMDANGDKFLVEGNVASGLGAVYGGCSVLTWYPITPSSSLGEAMIEYFHKLRHDPDTGKATYGVVQAEDELAAVGMAIGAGWAGCRAMTCTSGPGISLMAEFVGFAYFAEVPVVIVDVQRLGPSTGLPTRTSQGDISFVHTLSHGDTRHVCLLPSSVEECFEFGWRAFDLAERLQAPVFVMSDLDLGMNTWMCEPFAYPDVPMDRGKLVTAEDLQALGDRFRRYGDEDGTGVCPRPLPSTRHPAAGILVRGSGHNAAAVYTEKPEDYLYILDRLRRKYAHAATLVPPPVVDLRPGARVGIVAYGSTHATVAEARDALAGEGVETSYLLLKALPFTPDLQAFVAAHDRVYVVEQNVDGQMHDLVRLDIPAGHVGRLRSVCWSGGLPIHAGFVAEKILHAERAAEVEPAGEVR